MATTVVNIKQPYDVYIGRPRKGQAWGFGNPFELGKDGARAEVIYRYQKWLVHGESFDNPKATPERRQWILDNVKTLKDKRLGCFCKPQACHGDVLVWMADNV